MIAALDPKEDGNTILQRRAVIEQAKRSIIALNPPQDQFRNLQPAMNRCQDKSLQLNLQTADLQQALLLVQNKLQGMSLQEEELIVQLTIASHIAVQQNAAGKQNYNAMSLQLQTQCAAMQQQMQSERSHMSSLIGPLQTLPGMTEEAIRLLPRTSTGHPAPPTPGVPTQPVCPVTTSLDSDTEDATQSPIDGVDDRCEPVFGPVSLPFLRPGQYIDQDINKENLSPATTMLQELALFSNKATKWLHQNSRTTSLCLPIQCTWTRGLRQP